MKMTATQVRQQKLKADIIDFKAQLAAQRAKAFYALKAKYIAQSKQGSN